MRFACDSCLTRYTLADEKVRGRVLKIRCKTCGTVMVVKDPALAESAPAFGEQATRAIDPAEAMRLARAGDGAGARPAADGAAADADSWENQATRTMPVAEAMRLARTGGPVMLAVDWFAMRKGEQLGPMTTAQLEQKPIAGELGKRSFVWREGMGDWQRLETVEELASLAAAAVPAEEFVPTPGPVGGEPPAHVPTPTPSVLDAASLFDMPEAPAPEIAPPPALAPEPAFAPVVRHGGAATRSDAASGGGAWALQRGAAPAARPAGAADARQTGSGRMLKLVAAGVILAAIVAAGAYFLLPAAGALPDDAALPAEAAAPAEAGGMVRIGDLNVTGFPGMALRKALATRIGGYHRCVVDHAAAGAKARRVVVRAVVAPSGKVTTASSDGGGELGACLADRTRDIRFPSFEGEPVEISVPLEIPAS